MISHPPATRYSTPINSRHGWCQDIAPETIVETLTAECTLRQYLNAGGKIVVYADIPLWYVGHADNTRTNWWAFGMAGILDIPGMNWNNNTNSEVTITDAGVEWGLTQTWTSIRWTPVDDPDAFTILATDRNGNAAAWVKHFVPVDRTRGFVRIFDVDVWRETVNPPGIEDLLRVAEYGLPKPVCRIRVMAASMNKRGSIYHGWPELLRPHMMCIWVGILMM